MLRAQVRVAAACKKEEKAKRKEGASLSAPKAAGKGVPKRKADVKDDRSSKKVSVTPSDKLPKKPSPPKPKHGVSKGLMMMSGPVTQEPNRRFLTHKNYVVVMMGSIINDKVVDPCVEQVTEELQALSLFDLARVRLFPFFFSYPFLCLIADDYSVL